MGDFFVKKINVNIVNDIRRKIFIAFGGTLSNIRIYSFEDTKYTIFVKYCNFCSHLKYKYSETI